MSTKQKQSVSARNAMKKGLDTSNDMVKVTIGPKGRNVVIEREYGDFESTQDGVTVIRSLSYKNRFENIGHGMGKRASVKTNDEAGDATTATYLLTQAFVSEGMKYSELGVSAISIGEGMQKAINDITVELDKKATPIKNKKQMEEIATISGKSSKIGKIVSDLMDKVGEAGIVNVEKGATNDIEQEIVEGFRFSKGFMSPHMVTEKDKEASEIDDAKILITDKSISEIEDILPILKKLGIEDKKEIVVICGDMVGNALMTLVVNCAKNLYKSLVVKAPDFGEKQKQSLQDIAILTGGTVISQDIGIELKDVELEHLGSARKIISTKDTTTIIEGGGKKKDVLLRIKEIKKELSKEKSDFNKEALRERLGRLSGVIAIIKVGANSETEQKDLELRIEDALSSTQSSLEEGIVKGGGLALIEARNNVTKRDFDNEDEKKGYEIVMKSISKPFEQILINAGKFPEVILNNILNPKHNTEKHKNIGYDASSGKYVDMFKEGIIDAKKAVRCALKNAGSEAKMFLSTEGVICFEDEEQKQ